MELWHSVVLGIIQGLAEFLPISSSGHLIIVSTMLQGRALSMSFEVALHVGTLLALLVYFWKDWIDLLQGSVLSLKEKKINPRSQLLINLIVGTVPAAIIGKLFEHQIEEFFSTRAILVCFPLIIVGILLWWVDRKAPVHRKMLEFKPIHGLLVGVAQACALFPGTSRSGATIIASRLMGLDRSEAARFSFLLGTPITAGAALLKADEILASIHLPEFYVGMLVSAVTGWLVIGFLMRYLRKYGFGVFAIYRVVLALVSIGILMSH
ncbi:MAG TPA: undecaprenyl-diphosphate phosphatase [Oligoflexus sp.]|uniref:undecaprenyl-diphosphate phosphatase n=1 Tax=Oligoflexus sp. TaxID=1971216 RepID=UPI002D44FB3A|nr:undecaprenyl-diphosphate phosphatase [Oligoflexus sp.]HYX39190.1 undecaprenyl-diphosphate phosphatase [Oligoflexus sp.]